MRKKTAVLFLVFLAAVCFCACSMLEEIPFEITKEDGKLVIGKQKYTYVIDTCCEVLLPNTRKLLEKFQQAGGQMTTAEALPANLIVDNP